MTKTIAFDPDLMKRPYPDKPHGISGWLLLFVIGLGLSAVSIMMQGIDEVSKVESKTPALVGKPATMDGDQVHLLWRSGITSTSRTRHVAAARHQFEARDAASGDVAAARSLPSASGHPLHRLFYGEPCVSACSQSTDRHVAHCRRRLLLGLGQLSLLLEARAATLTSTVRR